MSHTNHLEPQQSTWGDVSPQIAYLDWNEIKFAYQELLTEEVDSGHLADWLVRWSDLEKLLSEADATFRRSYFEGSHSPELEASYRTFVRDILPQLKNINRRLEAKLIKLTGAQPEPVRAQMVKRFSLRQQVKCPENQLVEKEIAASLASILKVTRTTFVTIEAEQYSITQAERMLSSSNRCVRENVWRAVEKAKVKKYPALDKLTFHVFALRQRLSKNARIASYRDYRWSELGRNDYSSSDADNLIKVVEATVVPIVAKLHRARRARLGVVSLKPWDLRAHCEIFTHPAYLESSEYLFNQFEYLLKNLDSSFHSAFVSLKSKWLSTSTTVKLNTGISGYTDYFPVTGRPYINFNFTGQTRDLEVLSHEFGHAYHYLAAQDKLYWNQSFQSEFSEVAATVMEMLTLDTKTSAIKSTERTYFENRLEWLLLPTMIEAFQHWLYTEPSTTISTDAMDQKWLELQRRFYPEIDDTNMELEISTSWRFLSPIHVSPFYSVSYLVAFFGALQIWRNAQLDQAKALNDYKSALRLGAEYSLTEVFAAAGAQPIFDQQSIKEMLTSVAV